MWFLFDGHAVDWSIGIDYEQFGLRVMRGPLDTAQQHGRGILCVMGANTGISVDEQLPAGVKIGAHTYGYEKGTFKLFMEHAEIEVGAFCSIGPEVKILAGSEHIMSRATTFPLNALLFDPAGGNGEDAIDRGVTRIGNDVWLGLRAMVLSGVSVGDGAVVGAGAVVTKDVEPYAVVAGNPARIIRYRFEEDVRRRLLALRWWEWDEERLRALRPWLMSDVEGFLDHAERDASAQGQNEAGKHVTRRARLRDWLGSG